MKIKSKNFITNDFLLQSELAKVLYHNYAKNLPIIDYHNHLSPRMIAENRPIENITKAWLDGDHYKWRGMRANGVDEKYITGNSSLEKRFEKWAETVPYTVKNPLFHWTHLELKRYFDIDEILQENTWQNIYDKANSILAYKTPADLLKDLNVEVVCTTDDPTDDLKYHQQIAKAEIFTKVLPTFRPDALFAIGEESFLPYLEKLSTVAKLPIKDLSDFSKCVQQRIEFFHNNGCCLSDFGGSVPRFMETTTEEATLVFAKALQNQTVSQKEKDQYQCWLFVFLGKSYHEKNWVQQYHLGAIRNNNSRLMKEVGLDAGCDSIADFSYAEFLSGLFNTLNKTDELAKTIAYNLNPSQNEVFATMMGNFNSGNVPGKMQWGSAWWFLDQKDGMENQIETLSNMGLLSRFVGMLTDSRSFLSFPRHEYFRRILCNIIAKDTLEGMIPNDEKFLGTLVQNICYYNAKNYFNFQ